jgi:hypothetical protein
MLYNPTCPLCVIIIYSCLPDPLVHYGHHFCQTAHALCSVHALIQNGIRWMDELTSESDDSFTTEYATHLIRYRHLSYLYRELREHRVFLTLLHMIPGLEDRLRAASAEETRIVADLVSLTHQYFQLVMKCSQRFKRGPQAQDLTILEV